MSFNVDVSEKSWNRMKKIQKVLSSYNGYVSMVEVVETALKAYEELLSNRVREISEEKDQKNMERQLY